MEKKKQQQLEKRIVETVVQRLTERTPEIKSSKPLTTDRVLVIVPGLLSFALTIVGIREVYPFWLNLTFYLAALVGIILAVWQWERNSSWRWPKKLRRVTAYAAVYLAIVAFPVWNQYEREISIRISFKDSPSLTWYRKQRVMHDISAFKKFLTDLDINVGSEIPPITTGGGRGFHTPADKPVYRGELMVPNDQIKDPMAVTTTYGTYAIDKFFEHSEIARSTNVHDYLIAVQVGHGLNQYLNWSFWSRMGPMPDPYAAIFWHIRSTLGSDFTDRLAASTLKVTADSPQEGFDPRLSIEIWRKVKIADSIVESNASRWPQILTILKNEGQPVDML